PSSCFSPGSSTPWSDSLSLHDALPISIEIASSPVALLDAKDERISWLSYCSQAGCQQRDLAATYDGGVTWKSIGSPCGFPAEVTDRKSTRLNSSHEWISYAVFCLKKKK